MASTPWVGQAVRRQLEQPSLTLDRERDLLATVQTATVPHVKQKALTELWEAHSKLVVAIAHRYRRPDTDILDLIGAGHLGLHAAISRFDLSRKGIRLSTYATSWIRWFIVDHIRRNATPIRLPGSIGHRQLAHMSRRLLADAEKHCARERIAPTDGAIAERIAHRIGLTVDEVRHGLRLMHGGTVSLHDRPGGDDAPQVGDQLTDSTQSAEDDVILRLDRAKARNRIVALIEEILGERERTVFRARFLHDGEQPIQLDVLAQAFGVSRERIYQIEVSARHKIATALAREGYGDVLDQGGAVRLPRTPARRRLDKAVSLGMEQAAVG